MANTKISEGSVITAASSHLIPVFSGTASETPKVVTAQTIANLAPSAGSAGTRIGSALTGNGTTNVHAALQASVDAVPTGGTWILDPGTAGEEHFVNDTLVIPININVIMRGAVVASFTDRPIIQVGPISENENGANGKGLQLVLKARGTASSTALRSSTNENWVAIRLVNIKNSNVTLQHASTHIGCQLYATNACFGNFIQCYHSLQHRIHFETRTIGSSVDPNAPPGSDSGGGEYINANTVWYNRMDNTSAINGSPDASSVAFRMHGTHGGYERCHGNRFYCNLLQLQDSSTAQRRGVLIDAGQPSARGNYFHFNYWETGNGAIGELHSSVPANGNVIKVDDWVPGNPTSVEWTGGTSGFGGRNIIEKGPLHSTETGTHVGREFKPGWRSGPLVDKVSYYNDTSINLKGVLFHKTTASSIYTYTDKPPVANITPGFDFLRINTGGLFFWLNTEDIKQFLLWRDCLPGFGGRIWLVPCDAFRRTIGATNISAAPGMSTNGTTQYTGATNSATVSSSDIDEPVHFRVSTATKWVLCGVVTGTNPAIIRELQVSSLDPISEGPVHVAGNHEFGEVKTLVAAKTPSISSGYGFYRRGDILENDGSVTSRNTTKRWVCPANMILAPTWTQSNTVFVGDLKTGTAAAGASGNVYRCIVAGTTASTGNGPTGTSTSSAVTSGSSQFLYAGPAFQAWSAET